MILIVDLRIRKNFRTVKKIDLIFALFLLATVISTIYGLIPVASAIFNGAKIIFLLLLANHVRKTQTCPSTFGNIIIEFSFFPCLFPFRFMQPFQLRSLYSLMAAKLGLEDCTLSCSTFYFLLCSSIIVGGKII